MSWEGNTEGELTYQEVIDILDLVRRSARFATVDLMLGPLNLSLEWESKRPSVPVPSAAEATAGSEILTIPAPALGTFLRHQRDQSAPIARAGLRVSTGDSLGFVDTLGQLTTVLSPMPAEVLEFIAQHADFVEYGQPLLRLRPL